MTQVAGMEKTYQWLNKSNLSANTEAMIMAAQEQALNTRAIAHKVYRTRDNPRCRLCNSHDETVAHLVSGCSKLAGTAYTERHNHVASTVYRAICSEYDLEHPNNWWELPEKVVENPHAKILWDFYIQTDKMVQHNKPDTVIIDKVKKTAIIIDVAVPRDENIKDKEQEKIDKYQPLKEELEKLWEVKTKVLPVVVGSLGAVTKKLHSWLSEIPGKVDEISLQKSVLLDTCRILRRTLKLPGLW